MFSRIKSEMSKTVQLTLKFPGTKFDAKPRGFILPSEKQEEISC